MGLVYLNEETLDYFYGLLYKRSNPFMSQRIYGISTHAIRVIHTDDLHLNVQIKNDSIFKECQFTN